MCVRAALQPQLHTLVRRLESKRVVETVCIRTAFVRRQLNYAAAAFLRTLNNLLDQEPADTLGSIVRRNSNALDLGPFPTLVGQPWDEGHLQHRDDASVMFNDHDVVTLIDGDGIERVGIEIRQGMSNRIPLPTQFIIRQKLYELRKILYPSGPNEVLVHHIPFNAIHIKMERSLFPA